MHVKQIVETRDGFEPTKGVISPQTLSGGSPLATWIPRLITDVTIDVNPFDDYTDCSSSSAVLLITGQWPAIPVAGFILSTVLFPTLFRGIVKKSQGCGDAPPRMCATGPFTATIPVLSTP